MAGSEIGVGLSTDISGGWVEGPTLWWRFVRACRYPRPMDSLFKETHQKASAVHPCRPKGPVEPSPGLRRRKADAPGTGSNTPGRALQGRR
jgi:hypothetical protein